MPNHRCIFSFGPQARQCQFSSLSGTTISFLGGWLSSWTPTYDLESDSQSLRLMGITFTVYRAYGSDEIAFCMFSIHVANCLHYSQKNFRISNCKSITPRFWSVAGPVVCPPCLHSHLVVLAIARYVYGYYMIDKQFKRRATWPSGLRRQNQAVANLVFGRGFESHCCQLICTILILYSKS